MQRLSEKTGLLFHQVEQKHKSGEVGN